MALTKRARAALEVLKSGGYFRKQLETTWSGETFVTRLHGPKSASGGKGPVIPGIGIKTFFELESAEPRLLKHRSCETSSVWPEEWESR
jgi:hypothetical protein